MRDERRTIQDYTPETFERVRQTCLHLATVLGDWMGSVTLVGGFAPSLLVPQDPLPAGVEPHPGTLDIDLGLELAVLDDEGYASIAELLRGAGYQAEIKEEDRLVRQTWRTALDYEPKVTIDFLIPRSPQASPTARIQNLEGDFAAIIADGLQLVAQDRLRVVLDGRTLRGEQATRAVWVCGPASFTVLKARANHLREKPKDAFDLHYVLANFPAGVSAIASDLRGMMDDPDAAEALAFMEHDFKHLDSIGPRRTAYFAYGPRTAANQEDHDLLQASAQAYVQRLLSELR